MENFTPLSALLGGSLIGLAASLLMLSNGQIAGVSGIFAGFLDPRASSGASPGDRSFRAFFLAGLLLAGVLARAVHAGTLPASTPGLLVGAVAGLLVGFGTRLGSGCTSGHGVCGLSRLSKRSLVATITFMATAMLTVAVLHAMGARS
jgi:uncharacterized membrane protein YedE/YeeE